MYAFASLSRKTQYGFFRILKIVLRYHFTCLLLTALSDNSKSYCRGPAPADPGYSKRGRRRRPIYLFKYFIKDIKSNRMRIAQ